MKKLFSLEEIQRFYPEHKIISSDNHFIVENFFQYGDFVASVRIRKNLDLFQNGNPLLPTVPFHVTDGSFSTAVGTSVDGLYADCWFINSITPSNPHRNLCLEFGNIADAKYLLGVVYWDQRQQWFRTGTEEHIAQVKHATAFTKAAQPEVGTGQDIWLLPLESTAMMLYHNCVAQYQTIVDESEQILKTVTFPHASSNQTEVSA